MIKIIPATQEHVAALDIPLKRSAQMIVFVRSDGAPVGYAGVFPETCRLILFSKLTDEARAGARAIVRGCRQLLELADRRGIPVHALPDPGVPASERFLHHMGFTRLAANCWERLPGGRA